MMEGEPKLVKSIISDLCIFHNMFGRGRNLSDHDFPSESGHSVVNRQYSGAGDGTGNDV